MITIAATPVLKWAGGKGRLVSEILRHLPCTTFGRYHEPFLGGGAMFFALARAGSLQRGAALSDINADVINMYCALAWNLIGVERELGKLERAHRRAPTATFDRAKKRRNREAARLTAKLVIANVADLALGALPARPSSAPLDLNARMLAIGSESAGWAARVLYLNRACFNGLWRVNKSGAFNVPLGDYHHKTLDVVRANSLYAASAALRSDTIAIRHRDYLAALGDAKPGDLVYADPPYFPVSPTASFAAYTAGGFGLEQQRELASALNTLAYRGVHVLASNADTPLAREVYAPYRDALTLTTIQAARAINSRGGKRGTVGELVIASRPQKTEARTMRAPEAS